MTTGGSGEGAGASAGAGAAATPPRTKPWAELTGRLMLGHMLAYPLGFVVSIAAIPLALVVREDALADPPPSTSALVAEATRSMSVSPYELAQLEVVLRFVGLLALAVMAAVHLAALPWALGWARVARDRRDGGDGSKALETARRGGKIFWWTFGTLSGLVALLGAASWLWLLSL